MDFSRFILKRKKAIVAIWVVAFIIFLPLIFNYGKFVSYSISSSALSDTESGRAQTLLNSFSPVNSSLTIVIPVNNTQANSTFTNLVNSTLAFQQAVNSSSIPYLQGSKSAFTDYQQFLNSILSANSQTIINTYQNISQLSSQ